jgi:hypothetical protein
VVAALSCTLTGSRIAAIDRIGVRSDIVASIFVTALTITVLRTANHRLMVEIDRPFFPEAYNTLLTQKRSNSV